MQRTYYTSQPQPLEFVTRDFLRVRIDIRQEENDSEPGPQFSALESVIYAPFSQNQIIETVFTDIFGNDYENKLINEYNSALLDVYSEDEKAQKIERYKEFLQERKALKEEIETICKEHNIN